MGIRGWNSVQRWLRASGISLALAFISGPVIAASSVGDLVKITNVPVEIDRRPTIAVAPDGRSVVVGGRSCAGCGFAQPFDALGRPVGSPIDITPAFGSGESNSFPDRAAAIAANGDFVTLFTRLPNVNPEPNAVPRLYLNGFSFNGTRRFGPVLIGGSDYAVFASNSPAVSVSPAGDIVVAWFGYRLSGDFDTRLYAQRFDRNGNPVRSPIAVDVNQGFVFNDTFVEVDVAVADNGIAVISWVDKAKNEFDKTLHILSRAIFPNGSVDFAPVQVSARRLSAATETAQSSPSVAVSGQDFVVGWSERASIDAGPPGPDGDDFNSFSMRYRRLNFSGAFLGPTIDVAIRASATNDSIQWAGVSGTPRGGVVASWTGTQSSANSYFRSARWFDVGDSPVSNELAVGNGAFGSSGEVGTPRDAVNSNGDLFDVGSWFAGGFAALSVPCPGGTALCIRRHAGSEPVDLSLSSTLTAGTYNLVVRNLHPVVSPSGVAAVDAAVGLASNVAVSFPLPTGNAFTSSGTGWSCARSGTKITCSLNQTLAPASTAAGLGIRITSPQCQNGTVDTTFTLDANQFDAVQGNNQQAAVCVQTGTPGIRTNVTSFNFGSVRVGQSSVQRMLVITNTGTAPLRITSIRLAGDYSGSSGCSAPVAPGGTCTLTGSFRPTATGPRPGSVTITSNAPTSPTVVQLSGTGI